MMRFHNTSSTELSELSTVFIIFMYESIHWESGWFMNDRTGSRTEALHVWISTHGILDEQER
jgi:hypothetical protein